MRRNFKAWLKTFRNKISTYDYYVDFNKVYQHVDEIKLELSLWNTLVGSKNIESDFEKLIAKYPKALKCVPILLAVRSYNVYILDKGRTFNFNFNKTNYSIAEYKIFLRQSGLFSLLEEHLISNVIDYVTGVEVGLDSNGRKNRGGHLMENIVEQHLIRAGLKKGITYFKEMHAKEIEQKWNVDLSILSNNGKVSKRFDFVVKSENKIFAIETNFYNSGGSKLNETARSYKTIALETKNIHNFAFVWITDGFGWKSAKKNLEETFDIMEHIYCLSDLERGIFKEIF